MAAPSVDVPAGGAPVLIVPALELTAAALQRVGALGYRYDATGLSGRLYMVPDLAYREPSASAPVAPPPAPPPPDTMPPDTMPPDTMPPTSLPPDDAP
jgi:hypothetical protein